MKKVIALLGLVFIIGLGCGSMAKAGSGSSSSGEYSWTTVCGDGAGEMIFTNSASSAGYIEIVVTAGVGHFLAPGESWTSVQDGSRFPHWFINVEGESTASDSGDFSECTGTTTPESDPSFTVTCGYAGYPINAVTNTGNVPLDVTWQHVSGQPDVTLTVAPGAVQPIADTTEDRSYVIGWNDDGNFVVLEEGEWADCENTTPTTQPGSDVAPELISECRGADWYLVHPDDSPATTYAYRLSTGDILYDADYTSNNPAAVYGEVLIPAGVNEVGYADDFNATHTVTRPDCTTGGGGGSTTAPPTTAAPNEPTTPTEPTVPGEPIPNTPGLGAITTEGFVAPDAEIGPGMATFGATGFAPGEAVEVTLFSTPRALGTVTADASGNVSITFELLASDGAGEHRVEFSGPSGTVSVPFTLVLPAATAGLPETR